MNRTELWKILNSITPKKPVFGLACCLEELGDKQTQEEFIEKYRKDLSLTEKEIRDEIHRQKDKTFWNEMNKFWEEYKK